MYYTGRKVDNRMVHVAWRGPKCTTQVGRWIIEWSMLPGEDLNEPHR